MTEDKVVEGKKVVRIKPDVTSYVTGRSSRGAKVKISGDLVSQLLDGLSLEDTYNLTEQAVGSKHPDLRTKYTKLNKGHQRMCLGNLLRGIKSDEAKAELSTLAEPFRKMAEANKAAAAKVAEAKLTEKAEKLAAASKAKAEKEAAAAAAPVKVARDPNETDAQAEARIGKKLPGNPVKRHV